MTSQQEKAFCVLRFEVSRSVITVQREFLHSLELLVAHLKTEHTESLFLLRRYLGYWPRDPAVSMKTKLLVALEKLRQLPLFTVYVVPVKGEK
jgi:hypothetical protein